MESIGGDKNLNVHLFNCDKTYKLDAVEMLLRAVEENSSYKFAVTQHYFPLPKMAEISAEVAELEMDFAVFVVHANESRLSINEARAGIGYAKIYRSLIQATGGRVLIVIGGDENYKGEEDLQVLSRWARMKIFSQFSAEYLDGRKSFIFSWEKQHRYIHTEALLHFLDGAKADQIFTPVPRPLPVEDKPQALDTPQETQPKQTVLSSEDYRPTKREASLEGSGIEPTSLRSHSEADEPAKQIRPQEEAGGEVFSPVRHVFILSLHKVDERPDPVPILVDFFTLVATKLRFEARFSSSQSPELLRLRKKNEEDYVLVLVERATFEKEKKRVNSLLEEADSKAGVRSIAVICRDEEWKPNQHISEGMKESFGQGGGIVLSWNEDHEQFNTSSHQRYLETRLGEKREGMETRVTVRLDPEGQQRWFPLRWLSSCSIL